MFDSTTCCGRRLVGTIGLAAIGFALSSCQVIAGIEDVTVTSLLVSGDAQGVLEPLTVQLQSDRGEEVLSITADGEFEFTTEFQPGDDYNVIFLGSPDCIIENASGTLDDSFLPVEVVCDGVATLSALGVSGPTASPLDFSPLEPNYTTAVSSLQQTVRVTATAAYPNVELELRVEGDAVEALTSDTRSSPQRLERDETDVSVHVAHPAGFQRTYTVTMVRSGVLAQAAYGKASNPAQGDQFGGSVAVFGNTMAVGAPFEASASTGVNGDQGDGAALSGAVYVFRRVSGEWMQEAYIKASNTGVGDLFGHAIALSGDRLAVGAPSEAGVDDNLQFSGAVYVFKRTDGQWAEEAYIKPDFPTERANFGFSVALTDDTLAVGARRDDTLATDAGAAYVFRREGETWSQEAALTARFPDQDDNFGESIALSGDTLIVGAPGEDSSSSGVDGNQLSNNAGESGAAYVFERDNTVWTQTTYLKPFVTDPGDGFGRSVAASAQFLAIGGDGEDSNGNPLNNSESNSGAVYMYRRSGETWEQNTFVKGLDPEFADRFGTSVALSNDVLVVGAPGEDSASIGVGGDPTNNSRLTSGAVFMLRLTGANWTHDRYVKASNTDSDDVFGAVLGISDELLVVGAPGEGSSASGVDGDETDNAQPLAGAAYVYQ